MRRTGKSYKDMIDKKSMVSVQEPDVVCFLRKGGLQKFLGPGRDYGEKAAELVRKGYDIVGLSRNGHEFSSTTSAWLSTIVNLKDMTDDMYFCSEEQYEARTRPK